LSSLLGWATGLGGFGVPGMGLGYGGYGYGPYSSYGYYSPYARVYSSPAYVDNPPYYVDNSTTTQTDTYVTTTPEHGDYLATGRSDFLAGNYQEAERQANHAVIEEPQNPKAHELMMLSLQAQGEYQGATAAAHAVADLGEIPDWPTLYSYYKNRDKHVDHLSKPSNM
jgi:tetratricopeptide (TPR) repeat protein